MGWGEDPSESPSRVSTLATAFATTRLHAMLPRSRLRRRRVGGNAGKAAGGLGLACLLAFLLACLLLCCTTRATRTRCSQASEHGGGRGSGTVGSSITLFCSQLSDPSSIPLSSTTSRLGDGIFGVNERAGIAFLRRSNGRAALASLSRSRSPLSALCRLLHPHSHARAPAILTDCAPCASAHCCSICAPCSGRHAMQPRARAKARPQPTHERNATRVCVDTAAAALAALSSIF